MSAEDLRKLTFKFSFLFFHILVGIIHSILRTTADSENLIRYFIFTESILQPGKLKI